jgi:competence protein ComGC
MIKLFRNIRKNLLNEGKTSKYFKYAIGEIVLVVIGILIALQINNWNENRQERQQEQVLLKQLQSEFQSNLDQLDEKIELRNAMSEASMKLIDYMDHPEKRHQDSVIKYIAITQLGPTFDPIVNDLVSSGRIQLLQNQTLKEKLSLWTSEIVQVTVEEVLWNNTRSNKFQPYLSEKSQCDLLLMSFGKAKPILSLEGLLKKSIRMNYWMILDLKDLLPPVLHLQSLSTASPIV